MSETSKKAMSNEDLLWAFLPSSARLKKSISVCVALIDKLHQIEPIEWNRGRLESTGEDMNLKGLWCAIMWYAVVNGQDVSSYWSAMEKWNKDNWVVENKAYLLSTSSDSNGEFHFSRGSHQKPSDRMNESDVIRVMSLFGLDQDAISATLIFGWALSHGLMDVAEHLLKAGVNPNARVLHDSKVCAPGEESGSPLSSNIESVRGYELMKSYGWIDKEEKERDPLSTITAAQRHKTFSIKTEDLILRWSQDRRKEWVKDGVLDERFCTYMSTLRNKKQFKDVFKSLDLNTVKDVKGRGLMEILYEDCLDRFAEATSALGKHTAKKLFASEKNRLIKKMLDRGMVGNFCSTPETRKDNVSDPWEVTLGGVGKEEVQCVLKEVLKEKVEGSWKSWCSWSSASLFRNLGINLSDVMCAISDEEPNWFKNTILDKERRHQSLSLLQVNLDGVKKSSEEEQRVRGIKDPGLLWIFGMAQARENMEEANRCIDTIIEMGEVDFLKQVNRHMYAHKKLNGLEEANWQVRDVVTLVDQTQKKLERLDLMAVGNLAPNHHPSRGRAL
jgi:hypothetical protein